MTFTIDNENNITALATQGIEINYLSECRGIWIDRAAAWYKIIDPSGVHTESLRFSEGSREHLKHDRHHESEGPHRKSFFSDLLIEICIRSMFHRLLTQERWGALCAAMPLPGGIGRAIAGEIWWWHAIDATVLKSSKAEVSRAMSSLPTESR